MSSEPRLRGSNRPNYGPYPLGQIPDDVLREIGRQLVHRLAVGHSNIEGEDWGTIFASAVKGEHRSRPIGLSDVEYDGCAWSAKTVKENRPFSKRIVRLISGRNDTGYSFDMPDTSRVDPDDLGRMVLAIWNKRVNDGTDEHADLRIAVLIRNMQTRQFVVFEEPAMRFVPDNYEWTWNKNNNLEGRDKDTGEHMFTWQRGGKQFTIKRRVPASARRFSIGPNVAIVPVDSVLSYVRYKPGWIEIHG